MRTEVKASISMVAGSGLLLSALLFSLAESRPRWKNPCDLPAAAHAGGGGGPPSDEDLCRHLLTATKAALRHAEDLLQEFVDESFKDGFQSFVEGTASHRLNWLPKVDPDYVKGMDLHEFVPYYYSQLQYYAVGIEQIYMDQIVYDGKWFTEFREVEDNMAQIMCTLQMGLKSLGTKQNPDVTRDVMRQQYRNIASHSQRSIRNYLILRDYMHLLRIMVDALVDMMSRRVRTLFD